MLSLKAHWVNAGKDVSEAARTMLENRYAQWMYGLSEGNLAWLREVSDPVSPKHWDYLVMHTKALIGISSYRNHNGPRPEFTLEFKDV